MIKTSKILLAVAMLVAMAGLVFGQIPSAVSTTLTTSLTSSQNVVCVASATGISVPSLAGGNLGSILLVDSEAMQVTAAGATSTCFKVKRGFYANSTSNAAVAHGNSQKVWVLGLTTSTGDPSRPVSTSQFLAQKPYQPFAVVATPTLFGVATTSVTDVLGKFFYSAIEVDFNMIAQGACVLNGATVTTDKHIYYLWDATGTLIANTALAGVADAGNASIYQCQNFTLPIALQGPAQYFVGVQANGTTDNIQMYNTGAHNFPTGSQAGTFGTGAAIAVTTTFTAAVGPFMTLF